MSNESEEQSAKVEAAENVVERVESWDAGSQPEVAAADLVEGFAEAGVQVDDDAVAEIAQDVHDDEQTGIDPEDVS